MTRAALIACVTMLLVPPLAGAAATSASYSLGATVRCLDRAGAKVTRVRRIDSERIAFGDLAQRTSREARLGRRSVLLSFTPSSSNASFLRDALVVPDDPYVLRVQRNVVLMFRPGDAPAYRKVVSCLR